MAANVTSGAIPPSDPGKSMLTIHSVFTIGSDK